MRPTIVPYLALDRATEFIDFAQRVFGAQLKGRLDRPDGSLMHAELTIADSLIMVGTPMGEFSAAPGWLFATVDDCDAVFAEAIANGGAEVMPLTHMHHAGERYGGVRDPFGNVWWIAATPDGSVSWAEQQRRIDALPAQELGQ